MDESPADEVIKSLSAYKIVEVASDSPNRHVKIHRPKLILPSVRSSKENPFNSTIGLSNPPIGRVVLSTTASDDLTNVVVTNLNKKTRLLDKAFGRDPDELDELEDERDRPLVDEKEEANKMSVTKDELTFLISVFKAELQAKDMALTAIKYEQLKRLLNPIEISRSAMADAYTRLQDRLKQKLKDTNNNNNSNKNTSTNCSNNQSKTEQTNETHENQKSSKDKENDNSDTLNILNILLELLDRHPLLALPRDSLYCFDYKFDEQSTKNYLNLKIQHLEGLIRQHRLYRHFMNKRIRECEQSLFNISKELEIERLSKEELVKSLVNRHHATLMKKKLEELHLENEEEKKNKYLIVMSLLADLNEERDKNEILLETIDKLRKENALLKESSAKEKLHLENQLKELTVENSMLKLKLERRGSTTNMVKPQVPAKPAQLLDQKRNSNPKSQ